MATDHKSHDLVAASGARGSALQEEEVYGMLGALLGTLEVVATDDRSPLTQPQAARVASAVQLCHALQHQIEALLTLASDDLRERLRTRPMRVRPVVEHAARGAVRAFEARGVSLHLPEYEAWGQQRITVDSSRVDRMLKALVEALAASVGQDGALDVSVEESARHVALTFHGAVGTLRPSKPLTPEPTLQRSDLLLRGAARLFELHGGSFSVDLAQLTMCVSLPLAEAP
ncbi:MAG: hypothetical protein JWN48_738 [Myxococcaceae bacterium]|nr:hypothetical protein [Myxococcaceae bacterium]